MAKLIFILDGNVLSEFALDKERMTIGRRSSNDIHIDNLAVSGQHAEISALGKDVYLADLNSTNGTLVNGKAIKKHALKHRDVIEFGKYQLRYIDDTEAKISQDQGFADTVMVQPGSRSGDGHALAEDGAAEVKREPAPIVLEEPVPTNIDAVENAKAVASEENKEEQSQEASSQAYLKILSGDNTGQDLLLDKTMIKVGKPGEQLAVITKRQEGYFITHIAGDNYPLVNGESIGIQAYALKDQDQIEVLHSKMELHLA